MRRFVCAILPVLFALPLRAGEPSASLQAAWGPRVAAARAQVAADEKALAESRAVLAQTKARAAGQASPLPAPATPDDQPGITDPVYRELLAFVRDHHDFPGAPVWTVSRAPGCDQRVFWTDLLSSPVFWMKASGGLNMFNQPARGPVRPPPPDLLTVASAEAPAAEKLVEVGDAASLLAACRLYTTAQSKSKNPRELTALRIRAACRGWLLPGQTPEAVDLWLHLIGGDPALPPPSISAPPLAAIQIFITATPFPPRPPAPKGRIADRLRGLLAPPDPTGRPEMQPGQP